MGGYQTDVKVFPTQYSNSDTLNTVILDQTDKSKNVITPFEHVPSGIPQIYLSALNRADLEDMSMQLNPMILSRQGEIDQLQGAGNYWQRLADQYDLRYPRVSSQRGLSKLRFGQLWLDNTHTHHQFSSLYDINKLDDNPLPRGNNDTEFGNNYMGALGTSFKYNAVIKSGGVSFTCVNRGGSGCNVDVHLFKMKKKHVDNFGYWTSLDWSKIASPYEDAYLKRAHEIVTAENLRGRDPQKEDIWTKPKYPLLPGSRLMNAEDTLLNRVSKTSYYIPSQGRKNINIRFPGAKYDPCDVSTVFDGGDNPDYCPDYDEFTYFCLYSVTGEKSSAQYSTKNTAVKTYRVKADHSVISEFDPASVSSTSPQYILHSGVVKKKNSSNDGYDLAASNAFFIQHSVSPGTDVILGDNYSPFDLQIYGKYYESVAACELQPQKSKRMYVRGGLVDFQYDTHKVLETSVLPVPDFMQVKMAPTRTIKTNLVDENGIISSAVMDTDGGAIMNGHDNSSLYSASTQNKRRFESDAVQ